MANINELQQALVKADAAGDTDAAQLFANQINKLNSQQPENTQPEYEASTSDKVRLAAQGATFGFADEIEAGAKTGFGWLGDYEQERDSIREENQEFRDNAPLEALGYEIGGGVATAFIPGAGAANVARLGSGVTKVLSLTDKVNKFKNIAKVAVNTAKNSKLTNNVITNNAVTRNLTNGNARNLLAQGVASGVGYNKDTDTLLDDVVKDGLLSLGVGKVLSGAGKAISVAARNSPVAKALFNDTSSVMGDFKISQDLQSLVKTGQLTEDVLMSAYDKKAKQLASIGSSRLPQLADFDEFQGMVSTANRRVGHSGNLSGRANAVGRETGETIADSQAVRASEIQDSLVNTVDPRVAETTAGLEAENAIRANISPSSRFLVGNETAQDIADDLAHTRAPRARESVDASGEFIDNRFNATTRADGSNSTTFNIKADEILDNGRVNFQRLNDNVTKGISKQVDPLYKAAYATQDFGLNQLPKSLTSNKVFKSALKSGRAAAQNKLNAQGSTKVPTPFHILDFTKRQLDNISKSRTASPSEKADAMALKQQLLTPMRAASPQYVKALDSQAAVYKELSGITRGKDLFGTSEENALDILDGITNQDAGAVAAGYGREMAETILNSKGINSIHDKAVSEASLDRLSKMTIAFDNPEALKEVIEGGLDANQKAMRAAYLTGKAPKGQQSLFDRLNEVDAKDAEFYIAATSFAKQPKLSSLYYAVRSFGQTAASKMTPKEVIQHMQRTLYKDIGKEDFNKLLTGNLDKIPYEKWDRILEKIGATGARGIIQAKESSD